MDLARGFENFPSALVIDERHDYLYESCCEHTLPIILLKCAATNTKFSLQFKFRKFSVENLKMASPNTVALALSCTLGIGEL